MRTATILAWGQIDWWPENVFRGCCPCICLTLKLLSQLWLVVRDSVLISPPKKQRGSTRVCRYPCMCFHVWCVCSCRSVPGLYVFVCVCVFERVEEGGERERCCVPIHTRFGGFKVILSCFANHRSISFQSKWCLIQQ